MNVNTKCQSYVSCTMPDLFIHVYRAGAVGECILSGNLFTIMPAISCQWRAVEGTLAFNGMKYWRRLILSEESHLLTLLNYSGGVISETEIMNSSDE